MLLIRCNSAHWRIDKKTSSTKNPSFSLEKFNKLTIVKKLPENNSPGITIFNFEEQESN
jgi:hypothetical protein